MHENSGIGGRLKQARDAARLSQEEIAAQMGISLRAYQNYERGERPVPVELVRALSRTHGIDAEWLLSGRGEMRYTRGIADPQAQYVVAPEVEAQRRRESDLARLRELEKLVPRAAAKQRKQLAPQLAQAVVDFSFMYGLDEDGVRMLLTFFDYCDDCKQQ